jgi:hypothetical protein
VRVHAIVFSGARRRVMAVRIPPEGSLAWTPCEQAAPGPVHGARPAGRWSSTVEVLATVGSHGAAIAAQGGSCRRNSGDRRLACQTAAPRGWEESTEPAPGSWRCRRAARSRRAVPVRTAAAGRERLVGPHVVTTGRLSMAIDASSHLDERSASPRAGRSDRRHLGAKARLPMTSAIEQTVAVGVVRTRAPADPAQLQLARAGRRGCRRRRPRRPGSKPEPGDLRVWVAKPRDDHEVALLDGAQAPSASGRRPPFGDELGHSAMPERVTSWRFQADEEQHLGVVGTTADGRCGRRRRGRAGAPDDERPPN